MIKTGSFVLVALFLLNIAPLFASENVDTELSQTRTGLGERVTLTVSITNAGSGISIDNMPKVNGLDIAFSGTRRNFSYINGKSSTSLSMLFSVTPQRKGSFTIPAIKFRDGNRYYESSPIMLTVAEGSIVQSQKPSGTNAVIIDSLCELSAKDVFVGEPVLLRYYVLTDGSSLSEAQIEKMPEAAGFMIKILDEKIPATTQADGPVKNYLHTAVCIPAESGNTSIGGGSSVIEIRSGNRFGFDRQVRLQFDKLNVNIKALPTAGKPADFSGNVGNFTMNTDIDDGKMNAFEEKHVKITIIGYGNVFTAAKPVFVSSSDDVRVIVNEGEAKFMTNMGKDIKGEIVFSAMLIPEKPGSIEAGLFKFNYYDPAKATYITLQSNPVKLDVSDAVDSVDKIDFTEKDNAGFNFIWPAIILLVVLGCIVLIIYREKNRNVKASTSNSANEQAQTNTQSVEPLNKALEAARNGNNDVLVKTIAVLHKTADKSSNAFRALEAVQNEINALRYSNGKITVEHINDWAARLKVYGIE